MFDPASISQAVETLLLVCPVRVWPTGGAEFHLPPAQCRLAGFDPESRQLLVPGFASPFKFKPLTPGVFPLLELSGADGTCLLEFLSDREMGLPGEMSPDQARAHYNTILRRLLARHGTAAFRVESVASSRDPRLRWGCRFARLVFRRPGGCSAGLALFPYQGGEETAAFLTSALSWFDHCRYGRRRFDRTLVLLCPETAAAHLPGRLRLLNSALVTPRLWVYRDDLRTLGEYDPREPRPDAAIGFEFTPFRPPFGNPVAQEIVRRYPTDLSLDVLPHGFDQISCRGLPLVRVFGPREEDLRIGYRSPLARWSDFPASALDQWLRRVIAVRKLPSPEPLHEAFRLHPERWLESEILKSLGRLDPTFSPSPVYRQVPLWRGRGRSILDVLVLEAGNRPAVLEIKADRDEACLFQALDYWDRVRQGLEEGAFQACGYFPDLRLGGQPPRAYVVTPLFCSHPRMLQVARYLSRDIPLGIIEGNLDWRSGWRTVRRTTVNAFPG